MATSPEDWYKSLPKVTRGYLTAALVSTVAAQLGILSPAKLFLDFGSVYEKFEIWRLVTNFIFFGGFGLPFCFSMFFLVRYGTALESSRFENRAADFIWCMVITGLVQIAVAWVMGGMPFLAQAMLEVIVYLWSREFSTQMISIFGLFTVQAFYFPWVLCAITVLMGGSPVLNLVGIFAGHVYYFLEDIQGYSLKAPAFLSDYFDQGGVQARQNQNRTFGGGYNWGGGGQRLGA